MTIKTLKDEPTTRTLLAQQFNNQAFIPVIDVAQSLLGLEPNTAKRKASRCLLPFPTIRLNNSQKSPWLVSFDELVKYIERKNRAHTTLWRRAQT
ncbi:pyocin activator PrtN family protein [Vibrio breoganii]